MALQDPYQKTIVADGEIVEPEHHNKQENQLEALTQAIGSGGSMTHLTRFVLGTDAPATQFDVPLGVTIKPDGTEDYRGIYISAYLQAVSSSINNAKMVVTADLTETNYWYLASANDPRVKNGFITTSNPAYIRGYMFPWIDDGEMAWPNHQDTINATGQIQSAGFEGGWTWHPGAFTSFHTLRFYRASGGSYGADTFVEVWGVK
jgi:hypothetical protein